MVKTTGTTINVLCFEQALARAASSWLGSLPSFSAATIRRCAGNILIQTFQNAGTDVQVVVAEKSNPYCGREYDGGGKMQKVWDVILKSRNERAKKALEKWRDSPPSQGMSPSSLIEKGQS